MPTDLEIIKQLEQDTGLSLVQVPIDGGFILPFVGRAIRFNDFCGCQCEGFFVDDDGNVVGLAITDGKLPTVPPSVLKLKHLRKMDLSGNMIINPNGIALDIEAGKMYFGGRTYTAGFCGDDSDNDGKVDGCDPCPNDNPDDSDGDGVCDSDDGCPFDPNKTEPGQCGCGVDDHADSDDDGIADCDDQCPGIDDATFAPNCIGAIPTVSGWSLVVLGLLLVTMGKVFFSRRRVAG